MKDVCQGIIHSRKVKSSFCRCVCGVHVLCMWLAHVHSYTYNLHCLLGILGYNQVPVGNVCVARTFTFLAECNTYHMYVVSVSEEKCVCVFQCHVETHELHVYVYICRCVFAQ